MREGRGLAREALATVALGVVVAVVGWTGGPLSDPDVWWHVRTGRLILATRSVPHSDPWSFTAPRRSWVPTAWLSDVLFALADVPLGHLGLRVLRVLLGLTVVAGLWLLARAFAATRRDAEVGLGLVVLAVAPFLRERPQVLGLVFVIWLSFAVQRVLGGERPHLLAWASMAWIWAQVHGLWVLLPVAVLLVGVLVWLGDRQQVPLAARCVVVAVVSWLVVLVTPVGPRLAWWPLVVRRTAAPITEWQPTVPVSSIGLPLLIIIGLVLTRWATSDERVPLARIAYVMLVATFGLMAYRNVAPASILLLPELVRRPATTRQALPRAPIRVGGAVVLGLALAGTNLALSPTVSSKQPVRLVRQLAGRGPELRVLNHYDTGGLITGTASPPLHVAIDGRTDIWSRAFVRDYLNRIAGVEDWRPLVDALRPDAALLLRDSEVARGLVRERGWRVIGIQGRWEALERSGER